MADPNIFAWISPASSEQVSPISWNAMRMNIPLPDNPATGQTFSRASTAEPENDAKVYPELPLTFVPGPKGDRGFMIGWEEKSCDIVVPRLTGVSRQHCALSFDEQRRLILRDISRVGTTVGYDGKGLEIRRSFTWILGGHPVLEKTESITIRIHDAIEFKIVVCSYDDHFEQYIENVDAFNIAALGLQSGLSSMARTPGLVEPIRIKVDTLGAGAFAVVQRYWDVSTGIDYAYKKPLNRRRINKSAWDEECAILRRTSHIHIVQLLEEVHPWPTLALEFVPGGSLEDQHQHVPITDDECRLLLQQSLSALTALHEAKPQIVHRDLKPANILVCTRNPLHIKIADFGLAKEGSSLRTFCGTPAYIAPEIVRGRSSPRTQREKYESAVDIWSLGVIILQYVYSLPTFDQSGLLWCQKVVDWAKGWQDAFAASEDRLVDLLTKSMIIMEPKSRLSTKLCYEEALRLPSPDQSPSTPKPLYDWDEGNLATVVNQPDLRRGSEEAIVGRSSHKYWVHDESSAPSSFPLPVHQVPAHQYYDQNYTRSQAPEPAAATLSKPRRETSTTTSRKRSTQADTSSSSSGSRHTSKRTTSHAQPRSVSEPASTSLFGANWLHDPNCVGYSIAELGEEEPSSLSGWDDSTQEAPHLEEHVPRSIPEHIYKREGVLYYDPNVYEGDSFARGNYDVDFEARDRDDEETSIGPSGQSMARRLLNAIHEDDRR